MAEITTLASRDPNRVHWLQLDRLTPHPDNPRQMRAEIVDQLAALISRDGEFHPSYALLVRLKDDNWQIISGHHRALAAKQAGLEEVPCWVRDYDDNTAYMMLAKCNVQAALTPLERGMHALKSGIDVRAYATSVGRKEQTVYREVHAAKVAAVIDVDNGLSDHFSQLVEIHAAAEWLWPAMVEAMVAENWTVEQTRAKVARFKNLPEPPFYLDIAAALMSGAAAPNDIERTIKAEQRAIADLDAIEARMAVLGEYEPQKSAGATHLAEQMPVFQSYAEALEYFDDIVGRWRKDLTAVEHEHREAQRAREAAGKRAQRLANYVSLEEWRTLDLQTRKALLPPDPGSVTKVGFNEQTSKDIEWAMWSWNPITGCEHTCPYCYAREIAGNPDRARVFPYGFAPMLKPRALLAPRFMKLPPEAASDTRYKNVFLGSMADVFGRWVPAEWIEAVLVEIRSAPQWNFLCLTKFPKRMAEFNIPENCWMGTTVDLQARVNAAEEAFANVHSKVRWLSCEPLIEPLKFKHLDRFDWIVIGGASKTQETPEWRPPSDWIEDLKRQARNANLAIYEKTNLWGARTLELPFDAPIIAEPTEAPAVFHYLGKGS